MARMSSLPAGETLAGRRLFRWAPDAGRFKKVWLAFCVGVAATSDDVTNCDLAQRQPPWLVSLCPCRNEGMQNRNRNWFPWPSRQQEESSACSFLEQGGVRVHAAHAACSWKCLARDHQGSGRQPTIFLTAGEDACSVCSEARRRRRLTARMRDAASPLLGLGSAPRGGRCCWQLQSSAARRGSGTRAAGSVVGPSRRDPGE